MADETHHETPHGEDDLPVYDPSDELAGKVEELQAEDNAVINVYRQLSGNNAKMPFLFTVPIDKYTIPELQQYIRDNYGGGDFRIHIRHGRHVVANKLLTIEAPKAAPVQEQPRNNELQPVVDRLMDRIDRMEERISERNNNPAPQPAQKDPMDVMKETISLIGSMQGLFPQQKSNAREKSLLEQIEEAEKIYERLGRNRNDDGGFGQLMRDGLSPIIQIMQEEARARREGRAPNPSAKSQPKTDGGNSSTQSSGSEMDAGNMMNHVRTLVAAAERGGDPEVYAEVVLDFVPEEKQDEVGAFLSDPNSIDIIIGHFPQAEQHRDWMNSLREAILRSLDLDGAEGDTGGHADEGAPAGTGTGNPGPDDIDRTGAGAGGDTSDASSHVPDREGSEAASYDS